MKTSPYKDEKVKRATEKGEDVDRKTDQKREGGEKRSL